jgi:thiaminase
LHLLTTTRYVLDIGQSEDWLALQIALLPCLIGYGIIARRLFDDPKTTREDNKYWKWIETYVAEDYCDAMKTGKGTRLCRRIGANKLTSDRTHRSTCEKAVCLKS